MRCIHVISWATHAKPPNPRWPGDARIALNFVINYEEGSEPSIPDGDPAREVRGSEVANSPVPQGMRDLAAESMFEYGSRVGFWRLVRLFEERSMPLAVLACALAVKRNRAVADWIRESDVDVCCHGLRRVEHYRMDEHQERTQIQAAIVSLQQTTGKDVHGWYCRYGPSINTRRLLVEQGGLLYDSDAYNDDLPYWLRVNEHAHLVVPYAQVCNDMKFAYGHISTAGQFFEILRDTFDMLYHEGVSSSCMMSVGLHNRLAGHPGRAAGLAVLWIMWRVTLTFGSVVVLILHVTG